MRLHHGIGWMVLAVLLVLGSEAGTAAEKAAPKAKRAPDPAFAPVQDDPALPRVLLLGDSISIGYTPATRQALAGKANVHRASTSMRRTSASWSPA